MVSPKVNVFENNAYPVRDDVSKDDPHGYLSGGEAHYLWYFMQGSIMDPGVRQNLRDSWGLCQRHITCWLLIESAFRHDYLHGPSILMEDLICRAQNCFSPYKIPMIIALRLRNNKPCLMCSLGYNAASKGYLMTEMLERSRDSSYFVRFIGETELYWRQFICPRCFGDVNKGGMLCRTHLIQELYGNKYSWITEQEPFINYICRQLILYARSFRWECRGTETVEAKASLISAAGWLSGWTELINLFEKWR